MNESLQGLSGLFAYFLLNEDENFELYPESMSLAPATVPGHVDPHGFFTSWTASKLHTKTGGILAPRMLEQFVQVRAHT